MAIHPDYYGILGVSKTAPQDQIRKAYKKLAKKYHPDANSDDPAALSKFKEIQDAWSVLGDDKKRSNFDKYGSPDGPPFESSESQRGGHRQYRSDEGSVPFDLEELLSGFRSGGGSPFGGQGAGRGGGRADWPMRGQDIRAEVEVPFMLAATGGAYELRLQRESGGPMETLSVRIPAGIDTGSVIRLNAQGSPGVNGGAAGDLLVSLNVAGHPWFRREGATVLLDVPVSITECALGVKVDVPTVSDGIVTLTIPPGTSSGSKLRLRDRGIKDRRTGKPGHMLAVVKVIAPKDINERSRELLTELQAALPQNVRLTLWN